MSEGGAFLTAIDADYKKKEQKQDLQPPQQQKQDPPQQQKPSAPKKLEPLNLKSTQKKPAPTKPTTTTAQKQNPLNKRNSVGQLPKKDTNNNNNNQNPNSQSQKLPPFKKNNNNPQFLSQTLYNTKSSQHLGENKLKSFKSVMDVVRDYKTSKKDKQHQQHSALLESQAYLQKYKEKIVKDIENIYSQSEYRKVSEELVRLESKQFIQSEIQRTETLINKQKKIYNQTHYEMEKKEKQLKAINQEIDKVQILLSQGSRMNEYKESVQSLKDYEEQNSDVQFRQEALQYMVMDRQKMVINARNEVQKLYQENIATLKEIIKVEEDLQKHGSNPKDREKGVFDLKNMVEEYQRALKYENVVMGQHFEDQLEDELSEYEDKRALKQIFKHEARRKEEVERERQEYREAQNQKIREEKKKEQDKINKDMQEIKQILNLEIEKFQKLEKATGINVDLVKNLNTKEDVQKLERILGNKINQEQKNTLKFDKNIYILYKESLEKDNKNMEMHFKNKFEERILETKQKINDLKEQIQLLKYGEKSNEQDYDPNLIETLEEKLIQERDITQEKENQLRREEKIIDNICIVISRISYQLPFGKQSKDKNVKVLRKDLLDQISICGLQLEKMLAILSKKKDTIRIESVNTASDNKSPPEYLGLNNKIIKQIQTKNPKYNYSLSERVDESLDSMNNFPVKYMGVQQFIYAQDRLEERQVFQYEQSQEEQNNNSRNEEDNYFETFRKTQKSKIVERSQQI